MRLHVRLSVGAAPRPATVAGRARALAAALWGPRGLRHRLHRARRESLPPPRGHVRQDDRVLHGALALGLQRTPLSSAPLPHTWASRAVRLGDRAGRAAAARP